MSQGVENNYLKYEMVHPSLTFQELPGVEASEMA